MIKQIFRLAVYIALGWIIIKLYNEFFKQDDNNITYH